MGEGPISGLVDAHRRFGDALKFHGSIQVVSIPFHIVAFPRTFNKYPAAIDCE